ncbi:unnamed protein product, partial [Symbiodinium sp. CCMP2456]
EQSDEPEDVPVPFTGDEEIQLVYEKGPAAGGGPVEEVPSSEEEGIRFLCNLEKKKALSSYQDYQSASLAWQTAGQEVKASTALRVAIKMEKEHSYGSPKAAQKRRFSVPVMKEEPGLEEEPAAAMPESGGRDPQAPGEEPAAAMEDSSGAHDQSEDNASWNEQGWDSWHARGRWKSSGQSWKTDMEKYNDLEEQEDQKARAYWGSNRWQRDWVDDEKAVAVKRNKGKKRKLWLASQIETLKKQGRWVGGAPSESSKKLRLIREAEAKEFGRQGGGASLENPDPAADPDAAADEAPEDPGASDSMASFRSMIQAADSIEHV